MMDLTDEQHSHVSMVTFMCYFVWKNHVEMMPGFTVTATDCFDRRPKITCIYVDVYGLLYINMTVWI